MTCHSRDELKSLGGWARVNFEYTRCYPAKEVDELLDFYEEQLKEKQTQQ